LKQENLMSSSLEVTDQEAQAVAKAPRVTLADINSSVASEYTFTASKAIAGCPGEDDQDMKILTMCLLKMKNGFIVVGKSAPASPENFNAELGAKFAREDAIRQLWPIMGYALREKLAS
jgi:Phage protein (N4 Gp49/phage Sf6 gene 66) family